MTVGGQKPEGTKTYLSPVKYQAFQTGTNVESENLDKGDVFSLGVTFLEVAMLNKPTFVNNAS
jgi:hypothetical protein